MALPLLGALLAGLLAGCGGGDGDGDAPATGGSAAKGPASDAGAADDAGDAVPSKPARRPLAEAETGAVAGVVRWQGTPPERPFQKMVGDAWCMEQHEDGGFLYDAVVVGDDGGVANVFVQVVDGLQGWEIPDGEGNARLDQVDCLFEPKMVGVQLGQVLLVGNSDATMHNVHTKPDRNKEQNVSIPANVTTPREFEFRRPEIIEVVCDVHAWMRGWIGVVEHPFFAVTDAQGAWRIEGLPAGDYTLEAWHEKGGSTRFDVSVAAGGTASAPEVTVGG